MSSSTCHRNSYFIFLMCNKVTKTGEISPHKNLNSFWSSSRKQQSNHKVIIFRNFKKSVSDWVRANIKNLHCITINNYTFNIYSVVAAEYFCRKTRKGERGRVAELATMYTFQSISTCAIQSNNFSGRENINSSVYSSVDKKEN